MKVRLIKDNGMEKAKAGDIIEVTPAHGGFLICYGWAEPAEEARERAEKPAAKKTTKSSAKSK